MGFAFSRWFLAFLFCLLPLCASDVTVIGRVLDEDNTAIPAASVTLYAGAAVMHAVTDPTGQFKFQLPDFGHYAISAEHEGFYAIKNQPLEITPGTGEIHLVLNYEREFHQSIAVNATPSPVDVENTSSERRLSGAQVVDVPYPATRSVRTALLLMPGVVTDPAGDLHFDGGAENQTLYTLNGFNISDPLGGKFNSRVSVDAVRSLEYLDGRYSPEFGKGSAGALNIQTDTGDDVVRYSATNFVPGLDTKSGLHIGTWSPRLEVSGPILRGRAWFADNADGEYDETVIPGLPKDQNRTSVLQGSNLLHGQFNLTPANLLFADFLINELNAPETGLSVLNPRSTTIGRRLREWFYSFKDQIYLAPGALLELGFGENRTFARLVPQGRESYILTPDGQQGNYFADSMQTSRRDQFIANFFVPPMQFGGSHHVKLGTDLDRLNYFQNTTRTGYELYGLAGTLLRRTTFVGGGTLVRPGFEASSYAVDEWRVRPSFQIEAGIRQDWDELVRRVNIAPRAAVSWAPFGNRDTKLSGGYAVVYDATPLELFARPLDQYSVTTFYNPGGAVLTGPVETTFSVRYSGLKSPRYQNWSAGVERRLPWKMQLSLHLLRKRGENGFTYINPAGTADVYRTGAYSLANFRRDSYDSAGVILHQSLGERYEWMASYTRSSARSNAVVDVSVNEPLYIAANSGPEPWDSPNRFLSWGYLPTPLRNWAVAYLLEERSGFAFSARSDNGVVAGAPDSYRYPTWFDLNLHLEWRFHFRNYLFALRGGFNNVTNHSNLTEVNNVTGSSQFLSFYGSDGRHFVFRLRWLGRG